MRVRHRHMFAATLVLCWLVPATAEDMAMHQVQPGDTLIGMSERLLENPSQWRAVATLNGVTNPRRLQPGKHLRIPVSLLKGQVRPATVLYARGQVGRTSGDLPARPVAIGDVLDEGEVISVGPDSYASLRLQDGSQVHVQAGTVVRLDRLRKVAESGRSSTSLGLQRGRVDTQVAPQRGGSRFDVRTPLAVAGVRGTRFGVTVDDTGMLALSDVVEGRVAVQALEAKALAAQVSAGQGAVVRRARPALAVRSLLPPAGVSALPALQQRLPWPLAWPVVPGAKAYRVQLAEDESLTRVVRSREVASPAMLIDGVPDGDYVLSIRAVDPDGLVGREAIHHVRLKTQPVPPLAQTPGPEEAVVAGPVSLVCTDVPGVVGYRWQLQRGEGAWGSDLVSHAVREHSAPSHCAWTVDAAEPGLYRWRVASQVQRPDGSLDEGPFGDEARFVAVTRPEQPVPTVEVGDQVRVHWQGAPGIRFDVQLSPDPTFKQDVQTQTVTSPEVQWPMPSGCRPSYLRLRAVSPEGIASAFSPARLLHGEAGVCSGDGQPVMSGHGTRLQHGSP
ncbi:FecR domain-containing protein [Aquabacterium sp. CECT 9606]|uniref:FecR domain-containing protein n=1 Tax=Aquabacterium sp. CECT 9606 TaxID=2845822 RepID=UPI001E2FA783|nr:FecR domain-containing protein [Aquabacterium sp. CECT 9606]CAH0352367.1 hypothetical protein AQB9606_02561 [Aquabacterium sp. CECT 9606]